MKKSILVMLMAVMIVPPCLAQELEPKGMFSIEGTQWRASYIFPPSAWTITTEMGFSGGEVYMYSDRRGWMQCPNSFYVNALVASFAIDIMKDSENFFICTCIMQPLGIGVITIIGYGPYGPLPLFFFCQIGILHKIDDDWTPPEAIIDITPNQGEPGTTLTNVTIKAISTTFQDNPPVEISFIPPDYGLTASNIEVRDNTEIIFDLEIAVDAPEGYRSVIVTYDNGKKKVFTDFQVL
jgi:hypothetical protein